MRYIWGPLPVAVCRFEYFIKAVLPIELMLFFDAIVISKFVAIFCLKNPFGFQVIMTFII